MNKEEKKVLRDKVLSKRDRLDKEMKEFFDLKIFSNLKALDLYKNAKNIFIYVSYKSEIDTLNIINHAIEDNKNIFIPKTYKDKSMKAINIRSLDDLKKNKLGILEPVNEDYVINKKDIDLIIVPGAVFDKFGNRIGYGGGYYDRYLEEIKNKKNKVSILYDFQIVDKIEAEEHDIKVDILITQNEIIILDDNNLTLHNN